VDVVRGYSDHLHTALAAELRAIPQPRTTRRPILRRDPRFQMPKSFFEPLPESLLADFEGGA
jgi:hypothetical protein